MDLSAFDPVMEKFIKLTRTDLVKALLTPEFARNVAVYLTAQMDRAVRDNGDLPEGAVRTVRGQLWRGWARRTVTKYGAVTVDGTRFYMRKFSRKQLNNRFSAEAAGRGSRLKSTDAVEFRQVWRKRTGDGRYSSSSKLMQATGAMRQAWLNIQTSIAGNKVEFRPQNNVKYFKHQNAMRPIFVLDNPKDEQAIGKMVEPILRKMVTDGVR